MMNDGFVMAGCVGFMVFAMLLALSALLPPSLAVAAMIGAFCIASLVTYLGAQIAE